MEASTVGPSILNTNLISELLNISSVLLTNSSIPNITPISHLTGIPPLLPPNSSSLPGDLSYYERVIVLTWNSLISFTSVVGNTIVLVSSIKYNAIHLDRVSIILIRNLAAADLGLGLLLVNYSVNAAMGKSAVPLSLCWAWTITASLFVGVGSNFLAGLNLNKVSVLLFPLRSKNRSFKRGYIIAGVIWAIMSAVLTTLVVYMRVYDLHSAIMYNKYTFRCNVRDPGKFLQGLLSSMQLWFTIIPLVCVVVTTIWMGCFVKRTSGIQRQTVCTLLLVSVLFFLTLTPAMVFFASTAAAGFDAIHSKKWGANLQVVFPLAISVNCAANPFIYCLTVRSFGGFVKVKLNSAIHQVQMLITRRRLKVRVRIADFATRVTRNTSD